MWKTTIFLSSIESQPQKVGYFTQFEIFSHVGCSKWSHTNLKSATIDLKWVNLKYKTEHELHWCHFRFQHSAQWLVEDISYIILLDRWYACGTSNDNEWINLLRFWVHLLLLFAVASVMKNDLSISKIFIPTPYCWQKRTLIEMTACFQLLSIVVTCCHLLSIVVPLIVIRCHSLYHSNVAPLSFYQQSLENISKAEEDLCMRFTKWFLWRNWICSRQNVESCFSKLNLWFY